MKHGFFSMIPKQSDTIQSAHVPISLSKQGLNEQIEAEVHAIACCHQGKSTQRVHVIRTDSYCKFSQGSASKMEESNHILPPKAHKQMDSVL